MTAKWKKVVTDLWSNKVRSLLVALSVASGVFAVGLIATSFTLIQHDMAVDYSQANPHTAQIFFESFDQALLENLRDEPGVEAMDARYNLWIKVNDTGGRPYQINVHSIADVNEITVDRLIYEAGARELNNNELWMERQGAAGLGLKIGDPVELVLADGQVKTLTLVGTVHDVTSNPFTFTKLTSGYVTTRTMEKLGGQQDFNFVTLVTSGDHTDKAHIRAITDQLVERIQASGREVANVNITNPGQHPAKSIIDTVLTLLSALGVMVVFLSGFLVVNTISALMGQQIRQIGVMKALGATFGQVLGMYFALVLSFGLLALLIAMPLAAMASYALTRFLDGMLNATMTGFFLPPASAALQVLIGLIVPLVAALLPVISGARQTVRQAISSYGLNASKPGRFDRLIDSIRGLPRPLLLSLRNTFRRKGRLALTLTTLTLGGAIFIGVISVRQSIYLELDQTFSYLQSDVNVELARPLDIKRLQRVAESVPGVERVEGWVVSKLNLLSADGETSDQVITYAPPANTQLVTPVMMEGRWLLPDDTNAFVADQHFTRFRPDVKVGDTVTIRIDKKNYPFKLVGIYKMAGNSTVSMIYMNREYLGKITTSSGEVTGLRIVTDRHDAARQTEVMNAVRARFEEEHIDGTLQTGAEVIAQKRFQMDLLIYLLLVMAVLIAGVGGLGLAGTMSMNVLERTREIGVLRSIGAVNEAIFQLVVVEGVLIGVISWGLSLALAVPVTSLLDNALGSSLLTVPLVFSISTSGIALWLGMVVVLAALASLLPARSATRLTIRDVLAYE